MYFVFLLQENSPNRVIALGLERISLFSAASASIWLYLFVLFDIFFYISLLLFLLLFLFSCSYDTGILGRWPNELLAFFDTSSSYYSAFLYVLVFFPYLFKTKSTLLVCLFSVSDLRVTYYIIEKNKRNRRSKNKLTTETKRRVLILHCRNSASPFSYFSFSCLFFLKKRKVIRNKIKKDRRISRHPP